MTGLPILGFELALLLLKLLFEPPVLGVRVLHVVQMSEGILAQHVAFLHIIEPLPALTSVPKLVVDRLGCLTDHADILLILLEGLLPTIRLAQRDVSGFVILLEWTARCIVLLADGHAIELLAQVRIEVVTLREQVVLKLFICRFIVNLNRRRVLLL